MPLPGCDLTGLPGTGNTRADLAWLVEQGFDVAIARQLCYGGKLIAICGGMQMLGTAIRDPRGHEGTASFRRHGSAARHGIHNGKRTTVLEVWNVVRLRRCAGCVDLLVHAVSPGVGGPGRRRELSLRSLPRTRDRTADRRRDMRQIDGEVAEAGWNASPRIPDGARRRSSLLITSCKV